MYNAPANPEVFSWPQAYWCGGVACYAYCDNLTELNVIKDNYNVANVALFLNPDPIVNRVCVVETPSYAYVGVEGTARAQQWTSYLHRTLPVSRAGVPGVFPEFFATLADNVIAAVTSAGITKPIVMCGHSLGGAVASIAADQLRRNGVSVAAVWTFGSPKPGDANFAADYTIPNFRVFGPNDVVPALPPRILPYAFPFDGPIPQALFLAFGAYTHVGESVSVGDIDLSEVAESYLPTQDVAMFRAETGIGSHRMGAYQEATYVRLTPEQKGRMQAMFDSLTRIQSQGVIDIPFTVATPEEENGLLDQAFDSENDLFSQLAGEEGKLTYHLFSSPEVIPDGATLATFTEIDFPGYAPFHLPTSPLHSQPDVGGQTSEDQKLRFTLTQTLAVPVTVRGVYVVLDDDGNKLATAYAFPAPKALGQAGDFVEVITSVEVARVE